MNITRQYNDMTRSVSARLKEVFHSRKYSIAIAVVIAVAMPSITFMLVGFHNEVSQIPNLEAMVGTTQEECLHILSELHLKTTNPASSVAYFWMRLFDDVTPPLDEEVNANRLAALLKLMNCRSQEIAVFTSQDGTSL